MLMQLWKYVDDTTISEIVAKGNESKSQLITNQVIQWSIDNRVQLNNDKCKELRISFAKKSPEFNPILINGEELEIVQSAKLLGVTISHNLSWNNHITEIVKKAAKRLYFLLLYGSVSQGLGTTKFTKSILTAVYTGI